MASCKAHVAESKLTIIPRQPEVPDLIVFTELAFVGRCQHFYIPLRPHNSLGEQIVRDRPIDVKLVLRFVRENGQLDVI